MALYKSSLFYLSASVISALIFFTVTPLATRILGPEDYGIYAYSIAISTFISGLSAASIGFVIPTTLQTISKFERKSLISTSTLVSITTVFAFSIFLVFGYKLSISIFNFNPIPDNYLSLSIAGAIVGSPWAVAVEVITIDGRAKMFALGTILQTLANASALLCSLYYFNLGTISLFIGYLAGNATLLIIAVIVLWPDLKFVFSTKWLDKIRRHAPSSIFASLSGNVRAMTERALLSSTLGFWTLGVYRHSQQYQSYSMVIINAISRATWPTNLNEARDLDSDFKVTRETWTIAQAFIFLAACFFAIVGREFVNFLTNNKFTGAETYAFALLAILLIQSFSKPQLAILYAYDKAPQYARFSAFTDITCLVSLFALIPMFGVGGLISAIAAQYIIQKIYIYTSASKLRKSPFQDRFALLALFSMITLYISVIYLSPSVPAKLGLLVAICSIILMIFRKSIQKFIRQITPTPN